MYYRLLGAKFYWGHYSSLYFMYICGVKSITSYDKEKCVRHGGC